jgi:hypothetical protein
LIFSYFFLDRRDFIDKLSLDAKILLSDQDDLIQRKCETILNKDYQFNEMKDSKGNLNSMKGTLSYYHTLLPKGRSLNEAEYYYAPPIIKAHYPPMSK